MGGKYCIDRRGIGSGGGKVCAFDGGVGIARIRFVDKQGGRRTTHPHARSKNLTNIVKIIYVAFSGEEEPLAEAQKVKLEITIDKSARLIFAIVTTLCFRHIVL